MKQHKVKRDSIPATRVNKAEVSDHRRKKKDVSEIIYYNYNKKGHYLDKAQSLKSQKTSIGLGDFLVNDWC